jgi:pimeloyl-ACP methyl ester carboxylesterase
MIGLSRPSYDQLMAAPRAWVLLHGTPLGPGVWAGLSRLLREQRPVHAPVAAPRDGDRHPQADVAARLAAELPAVADSWDVVGHSFGGQVAIDLALAAPDRVATVSIICSRDTPFAPFAHTATKLRNGEPIDVEGTLDRWFRPEERQSGHRLVSYAHDCLTNADRSVWATALDGIAAFDRSDSVDRINAPALLICAELDPVSDPAAMAALHDRLPNAQLHVIPGAAHMSPLLASARLADELTRHSLA